MENKVVLVLFFLLLRLKKLVNKVLTLVGIQTPFNIKPY
jgi:hypothetical protein